MRFPLIFCGYEDEGDGISSAKLPIKPYCIRSVAEDDRSASAFRFIFQAGVLMVRVRRWHWRVDGLKDLDLHSFAKSYLYDLQ